MWLCAREEEERGLGSGCGIEGDVTVLTRDERGMLSLRRIVCYDRRYGSSSIVGVRDKPTSLESEMLERKGATQEREQQPGGVRAIHGCYGASHHSPSFTLQPAA